MRCRHAYVFMWHDAHTCSSIFLYRCCVIFVRVRKHQDLQRHAQKEPCTKRKTSSPSNRPHLSISPSCVSFLAGAIFSCAVKIMHVSFAFVDVQCNWRPRHGARRALFRHVDSYFGIGALLPLSYHGGGFFTHTCTYVRMFVCKCAATACLCMFCHVLSCHVRNVQTARTQVCVSLHTYTHFCDM